MLAVLAFVLVPAWLGARRLDDFGAAIEAMKYVGTFEVVPRSAAHHGQPADRTVPNVWLFRHANNLAT